MVLETFVCCDFGRARNFAITVMANVRGAWRARARARCALSLLGACAPPVDECATEQCNVAPSCYQAFTKHHIAPSLMSYNSLTHAY